MKELFARLKSRPAIFVEMIAASLLATMGVVGPCDDGGAVKVESITERDDSLTHF